MVHIVSKDSLEILQLRGMLTATRGKDNKNTYFTSLFKQIVDRNFP